MGFFDWKSDTNKTEKQEENDKAIKKLKKYANDFFKEPLKLEMSDEGFSLCPYCREEFKDKESIIKHLKRNKKEFEHFERLKTPIKIEINEGENSNENVLRINDENYLPKGFDERINLNSNEDYSSCKQIIENIIRRSKLFQEIKNRKYQEWKGEIKKKKPREHPVSPRLRFQVLQRDNFTCQYCGKKAPEVVLEVDHIEPYSKTKNNDINNLISACKECNRGKRIRGVI